MNCSEFHKQISLLVDGELKGPARDTLQLHLELCPDCRVIHQQMAALTDNVKAIRGPVSCLSLAQKVKERVALVRTREEQKEFFAGWTRVPLVALVTLLAVGLGNLAGRSVNEMLAPQRAEAMLEYMIPDQNGSLAEVVMDIGVEENTR